MHGRGNFPVRYARIDHRKQDRRRKRLCEHEEPSDHGNREPFQRADR